LKAGWRFDSYLEQTLSNSGVAAHKADVALAQLGAAVYRVVACGHANYML